MLVSEGVPATDKSEALPLAKPVITKKVKCDGFSINWKMYLYKIPLSIDIFRVLPKQGKILSRKMAKL